MSASRAPEDHLKAFADWERLCNEQGWGEASQVIHLECFLKQRGLFPEFAAYARDIADEENTQAAQCAADADAEDLTGD